MWGTDGGRSISDLRSLFTTLPTQVIVEVKLVGFDGSGGDEAIPLSPEYLLRHLESLQKDLVSVVLQPHVREMVGVGKCGVHWVWEGVWVHWAWVTVGLCG